MSLLTEILDHNAGFVERREYEAFRAGALPEKRLLIVACMDTRLVELLPRAMGLRNGDVNMVKTAGAVVSHPFGSAMRSILVGVYNLDVSEVAVVGHHRCGFTGLNADSVLEKAKLRGVPGEVIDTLGHAGIDLQRWLTGFQSPADGVRGSVDMIRNHPLMPPGIPVHGLVIHPETGQLELLVNGYDDDGTTPQTAKNHDPQVARMTQV